MTNDDKTRALRLAASAVRRYDEADAKRGVALRFAAEAGASLREISEATGVPHVTVKRILDRQRV